jgi:hypothetical protein
MNEEARARNEKFQKKMIKDYPEFVDALEGLEVKDLEENLQIYCKYDQDTRLEKETKKEILDAQEKLKELVGPYNDALKALKMKLKYINMLINEKKGVDSLEGVSVVEEV